MARRTKAQIQKEVAAASEAREKAYFEAQAKAKAGAAAIAPDLPAADAYKYSYSWKQDPGAPTGELTLIKSPNAYYDASTNTIVNPATGERTAATQSMWSGPTTFRADGTVVTDPNAKNPATGLTQAQQEAADALAKAKADSASLATALGAKIDPNTGKIISSTIDPTKAATWYASQNPNVNVSGKTIVSQVTNADGSVTITYSDGSTAVIPAKSVSGNINTGNTNTGNVVTGPSLAKDTFKATLALFFGAAEASKAWADALYNTVSKFYRSGSSVDESFNLALLDARNNPDLKPFTDRFKGIYALQDMKQAGKPVLIPTIAEYVASQAKMSDIFTQAGLGDLATEAFTTELISKGNAVSTIADKVAQVFNRIDMAPQAIKGTLSRFFPTIDRPKLARTILLGEKGVNELVDELGKLEVLAAAEQQGLGAITKAGGVDLARAQEYARMGGTFQSLAPKFGQIARALPDVQKLAGISRVADITQADVEKAVISQSEKELRRLEDISLQEEARFRARAGRAETGLASQRRANRAF